MFKKGSVRFFNRCVSVHSKLFERVAIKMCLIDSAKSWSIVRQSIAITFLHNQICLNEDGRLRVDSYLWFVSFALEIAQNAASLIIFCFFFVWLSEYKITLIRPFWGCQTKKKKCNQKQKGGKNNWGMQVTIEMKSGSNEIVIEANDRDGEQKERWVKSRANRLMEAEDIQNWTSEVKTSAIVGGWSSCEVMKKLSGPNGETDISSFGGTAQKCSTFGYWAKEWFEPAKSEEEDEEKEKEMEEKEMEDCGWWDWEQEDWEWRQNEDELLATDVHWLGVGIRWKRKSELTKPN